MIKFYGIIRQGDNNMKNNDRNLLVETVYKLNKIKGGLYILGKKLNIIKVPDRVLNENETHITILTNNGRQIRCLRKNKKL